MTEMPAALAARPVDPRRNLPIPFSSETPDGGHDFTLVTDIQVIRCIREKLCALCGTPLGYWISFLGGPNAYRARTYTDPPGHPDCMEWAVTLCPFIAMANYRRATARRHEAQEAPVVTGVGFVNDHPTQWVLATTRSYAHHVDRNGALVFTAAPFKKARWFAYDATGRITEENA